MRSEGSDIVADEESAFVMSETSNMADEKKQNRSGKKRSSKKKDDVHDLQGRMNAKFAEQEQHENASEHSEYACSIDNRSLLDLEGVNSTERFQRYLGNKPENTSTVTSTTDSNQKTICNVLGEKFGEDAYTYRSKDKTGIILEQNQIDILKGEWRSDTPQKVTCFRDSYRQNFPVDPSCENYFNVPTFDIIVESLLVKRFGPKAAFGRVPCLFSKELIFLEKIAYQGQLAARMGLITSCYTQQALGILFDDLQSDTPNLDGAVQNVRDIFALSTKTFDQRSRTGSFHHMVNLTRNLRKRQREINNLLSVYRI
ncbi:unnamed protein product [Mytilus coruscus]|uniref:Uncharacterized protein n=1 Tax=Mytilus coruscus TaxID=42192 RepID=A0A6J8CYL5_MYTCO|nr:unnamed protein product [Mytilus coruscus]